MQNKKYETKSEEVGKRAQLDQIQHDFYYDTMNGRIVV